MSCPKEIVSQSPHSPKPVHGQEIVMRFVTSSQFIDSFGNIKPNLFDLAQLKKGLSICRHKYFTRQIQTYLSQTLFSNNKPLGYAIASCDSIRNVFANSNCNRAFCVLDIAIMQNISHAEIHFCDHCKCMKDSALRKLRSDLMKIFIFKPIP